MKKNTARLTTAVAMLFVLALYFVGGTYARYASDFSGSGKVEIAKWAVALKNDQDSATTIADLDFVVQSNENVVPGKIAPGVTATATVIVDLTGTEVAVDLTANEVDISSQLAHYFGGNASDIVVTTDLTGATTSTGKSTIDLIGKEAFTSTNGKVTMTITVEWENNENNISDTAVGETVESLTIPVTLTVQQHID